MRAVLLTDTIAALLRLQNLTGTSLICCEAIPISHTFENGTCSRYHHMSISNKTVYLTSSISLHEAPTVLLSPYVRLAFLGEECHRHPDVHVIMGDLGKSDPRAGFCRSEASIVHRMRSGYAFTSADLMRLAAEKNVFTHSAMLWNVYHSLLQ